MRNLREIIKNLYIFEWFDKDFLEKIFRKSEVEYFQKWSTVIKQWEKPEKTYIIIEWIVSVNKDSEQINTIFEWDIFWEIAWVTNSKRNATIVAETDLELLTFDKNTLLEILKNNPNWEVIQKTILNRIIMNNKKRKYE
jgi:CRP-like cAMP-binding protein